MVVRLATATRLVTIPETDRKSKSQMPIREESTKPAGFSQEYITENSHSQSSNFDATPGPSLYGIRLSRWAC